MYLGVFLTSALGWQPWLRHCLLANVVEAFTIPADSMAPTISSGDYIMTRRWRGPVTRGDIVVYRRGGNSLVSRVVGLAGDTIAMREGSLAIGGRGVAEPYARRDTADPVYPELSWQAAHLTAAADRASIVKQPTVVYFSRDVGRGRIRWERIGREFRR